MSTIDLVLWGIIAGMALITVGRMIEERPAPAAPDQSTMIQRDAKTSMLRRD